MVKNGDLISVHSLQYPRFVDESEQQLFVCVAASVCFPGAVYIHNFLQERVS